MEKRCASWRCRYGRGVDGHLTLFIISLNFSGMMLEGLQFFYMLIPTSSFLSYQRIMIDEMRIFLDLISLHLYDFFSPAGQEGKA